MIFKVHSNPNNYIISLWAKRDVRKLFSFLPFLLDVFLAEFARPGRFKGEGKENILNRLRTKGRTWVCLYFYNGMTQVKAFGFDLASWIKSESSLN